jgi:hypothetical protein
MTKNYDALTAILCLDLFTTVVMVLAVDMALKSRMIVSLG